MNLPARARPDQRGDDAVVAALLRTDRHAGDEDLVVSAYLPWARSLARRYLHRGVEEDDLEQVASLALVKSLRRYEPGRGEFQPFAAATISGELKRHFRDHAWSIRPPRRVQELGPQVELARRELEQAGRTTTDQDIASRVGASLDDVSEVRQAGDLFRLHSVDEDEGRRDRIGSTDRRLDVIDEWASIEDACHDLADRDRRMLYLRFVRDLSQSEIGAELGVSQMQISRDLKRVLAALRNQAGAPVLSA